LKLLLKRADRIIVTRPGHISPHLSGHIEKVRTVPIGVDTEVFRPLNADRAGDILFLSVLDRYHDFKRLDVLLRAVRIAKRARPEIRLVVGGSGDLVDRYRALASSLGIAENVDFVGYVPAQRLVFYYNSCRLFALPSTDPSRETFGIVVLEALACGLPVVATEIAGAAKEIQETGAGIIVRPCDEGALASAVLSILENEDLASRMGKAGRRLALEKYAWRTVSRRIEQVYRELV
jgi:glycosyltransferase involved in cell wall biosynthesis